MYKDNETLFKFPVGSAAPRETCYWKLTKPQSLPVVLCWWSTAVTTS